MQTHSEHTALSLNNELKDCLKRLRKENTFNADKYIDDKCKVLNKYMFKCGLSSCVVAISGGIDSAVVLGLVLKASKMECSPIKKVVAVNLPIYESSGLTGQREGTARTDIICEKFGIEPLTIDLSIINKEYRNAIEPILKVAPDFWGIGQLGPYIRTPMLCYINTLLKVEGFNSITVGTSNRSELGYIGYVGKFSDESVDVQLISDIYKSQVYKIAKRIGVPEIILDVSPTGDTFDGRTDEEIFGAPYDFIELYCEYLNMAITEKGRFLKGLSKHSQKQFNRFAEKIENMHKNNINKYIAKSPAIHLDLFDASIKGGLSNYYVETQKFLNS